MKTLALAVILLLAHTFSKAQTGYVGIGTSTPGTTLDIKGGFTLRQDTVFVFSSTTSIPSNLSQVSLQGFTSSAFTLSPPTPQNAGQQLTIFNNVSGSQVGKMNGYTIPNGQSLTFRSNGTTAASFLPDASSLLSVKVISTSSSFVLMQAGDYFIEFTAGGIYQLEAASANTGHTICFYVGGSGIFPTVTTGLGGSIVNTGGTSTSSTLSLSSGNRATLISDGTNWIRIQ